SSRTAAACAATTTAAPCQPNRCGTSPAPPASRSPRSASCRGGVNCSRAAFRGTSSARSPTISSPPPPRPTSYSSTRSTSTRPAPRGGRMRVSAGGPSLGLLLGVPVPAHMRAGDDDLDLLWQLRDPAAFPAAYLADRQAALERRRANADALHAWLPDSQGSWD